MTQAEELILILQGKGGLAPDALARLYGAFWTAYGARLAPGIPDEKATDDDRAKVFILATHAFIAETVAAYDPVVKAIQDQAAADIEAARAGIDLGEPPKPEPKPLAEPGDVK